MASPARTDAENQKTLEGIKPLFERLRAEQIRNESVIERCEKDYREAEAKAVEVFGTSDEAEIRRIIEERRAANAAEVDDFVASVRAHKAALEELDARPA